MKRYPKYKDSGIEWIGQIPTHWKISKIKHLVNPYKYYQVGDGDHGSITPDMYLPSGNTPYIRVQNLSWTGNILEEGIVYIDEKVQKANLKSKLIPDDILIAKTGATIGKVGIIPKTITEANTTSSVGKVTLDKRYYFPKYVLYSFISKQIQDQIWIEASQKSAQPGFNVDDLVLYQIAIPNLAEQKVIADYLDLKTAQIDALIAKKERLIELLKEERTALINQVVTKGLDPKVEMKDSGIEWLGKVPKHWTLKKLKFLLRSNKGALKTGPFGSQLKHSDMQGNSIKVYNQRSVINGDFDQGNLFVSEEKFEELKEFEVFPNDIVITTRGTIGRCAIFPHGKERGILHPCLIRIQFAQGKISNQYAKYYMQESSLFFESVKYNSNATTIEVIYGDTLKDVTFVVPPRLEQEKILSFLERKTAQIDAQVNRERKSIGYLKEYRTALISEVVTGKIDVRGNA